MLSSVAEEIYSFKKGPASFWVLEIFTKFPSADIEHLMHVEVSVEDVKSCFAPCFFTPGFELHEKETEMAYNWHRFLRSVSKGKLKCNVMVMMVLTLNDVF